jgi:hypothetical protein
MKVYTLDELIEEEDKLQAKRMAKVEAGRVTEIVKQFRSWAVTVYGVECLDDSYDIPIHRLWEPWPLHMRDKNWVNGFDFLMAFYFARKHYRTRRPQISRELRYEVLERDGFRCQLCGRSPVADGVKLELDHKISRDDNGRTDRENLWTLCYDCNRGKGAQSIY